MRTLKHIKGKTIEEQIASIDGLLDGLLRRDRVMDAKVLHAAQMTRVIEVDPPKVIGDSKDETE